MRCKSTRLLKEVVTMWWSIGGGIIIFALGMFIFLKPGLIWKLTEEWKSYRADEPSEFYLKTTKIGGILFDHIYCFICYFSISSANLILLLQNNRKHNHNNSK